MGKRDKPITINRNKYNEIKKMDHNTMEEYINSIFEMGMKAAAQSFDTELCMESISQIKGIGQAKMEQIKLAMVAAGAKL